MKQKLIETFYTFKFNCLMYFHIIIHRARHIMKLLHKYCSSAQNKHNMFIMFTIVIFFIIITGIFTLLLSPSFYVFSLFPSQSFSSLLFHFFLQMIFSPFHLSCVRLKGPLVNLSRMEECKTKPIP